MPAIHSTPIVTVPQPTFTAPQTVADVVTLYLASANARELDSFDSRRRVLLDFAASYGALPLAEALPYHAQTWLDGHNERWASNWTKRRAIAGVHRAFNWAARQRLVKENPFRGVTAPAGERGTPMEEIEFREILRHSPPCFRRFVIALRMSGARPGELAKATLADVDEERACIELRKHKTAKKTGHARRIILHPVLCRYVAWRKRQSWQTALLFPNSRGRKWSNPAICWRLKEVRRLGGELRPETSLYGLRHSSVTRMVLANVSFPVIAEIHGHARIQTTMTYTHLCKQTDHLRAAMEQTFKRAG